MNHYQSFWKDNGSSGMRNSSFDPHGSARGHVPLNARIVPKKSGIPKQKRPTMVKAQSASSSLQNDENRPRSSTRRTSEVTWLMQSVNELQQQIIAEKTEKEKYLSRLNVTEHRLRKLKGAKEMKEDSPTPRESLYENDLLLLKEQIRNLKLENHRIDKELKQQKRSGISKLVEDNLELHKKNVLLEKELKRMLGQNAHKDDKYRRLSQEMNGKLQELYTEIEDTKRKSLQMITTHLHYHDRKSSADQATMASFASSISDPSQPIIRSTRHHHPHLHKGRHHVLNMGTQYDSTTEEFNRESTKWQNDFQEMKDKSDKTQARLRNKINELKEKLDHIQLVDYDPNDPDSEILYLRGLNKSDLHDLVITERRRKELILNRLTEERIKNQKHRKSMSTQMKGLERDYQGLQLRSSDETLHKLKDKNDEYKRKIAITNRHLVQIRARYHSLRENARLKLHLSQRGITRAFEMSKIEKMKLLQAIRGPMDKGYIARRAEISTKWWFKSLDRINKETVEVIKMIKKDEKADHNYDDWKRASAVDTESIMTELVTSCSSTVSYSETVDSKEDEPEKISQEFEELEQEIAELDLDIIKEDEDIDQAQNRMYCCMAILCDMKYNKSEPITDEHLQIMISSLETEKDRSDGLNQQMLKLNDAMNEKHWVSNDEINEMLRLFGLNM